MKTTTILFIITLILCSTFAACKKDKNTTNDDQLPAATQTGANTFGCLVNGKLFVPKGYINPYPNYRVFVDPGFNDGSIDIRVYQKNNDLITALNLGSDSIKTLGIYNITSTFRTDFAFNIYQATGNDICYTSYGSNISKNGFIKITKYDLVNGIISGEFEFTFSNPNCGLGEPIKITQGRFDKKF
jgi:hypothetical protein